MNHLTKPKRLRRVLASGGAVMALLVMALPAAIGALPGTPASSARAEITVSQDDLRTGWDSGESHMYPSQVQRFAQLFARQVTGNVYAQPLVVGSSVIVATEKDYVYALDSATGAIKWTTSLGQFYQITGCTDLQPDIGVTGAPVYDPANKTLYVMAQIVVAGQPVYDLFGLNATTGQIVLKQQIGGHPTNASNITFNATAQMARPGLLLRDGWVYAAFGSHCDYKPYAGFVAGVNVTTGAETLWSDEAASTNDQAGIWQSGSGLMSDGPGRIYFTSGNGVSPAPGPGSSPPGQLAESVVLLQRTSTGALAAKDFFSPADAPTLDAGDTDLGSGGPVGVPAGTTTFPHVLAQAGKDGRIFLLNRDRLGGRSSSSDFAALSVTGPFNGEWGHPAAFANTAVLTASNATSAQDYLYYIGANDNMRVLKFGVNATDKPTLTAIANTSISFGHESGSPAVTSNGTNAASAVVWSVYASGPSGVGGTLEAFPATPSAAGWPSGCTTGCTIQPLNSWPIGIAAKFANIATSGNRVYVGTRQGATSADGTVYGFGAPYTSVVAAPVPPSTPRIFTPTPVSGTATTSVTLTATSTMTVIGVSATTGAVGSPPPPGAPVPSQFTVSTRKATSSTIRVAAPSPAGVAEPGPIGTATPMPTTSQVNFPITLHKGDKLTVPVTFTPSAPGGATGTVVFATSAGPQAVAVTGTGTTAGLYANQKKVQFALVNDTGQFKSNVPAGIQVPREFNIVNGSTKPVTITSVRAPAHPYHVTSGPKPGDILQPGESQVVQIEFAPVGARKYPATYSITASNGTTATVRLTGAGLRPTGLFKASPAKIYFGSVKVGRKRTRVITLANAGNEPATVVGTSRLTGPFTRIIHLPPQLPINAGYKVRAPISFTPRHRGTFTTRYTLTWSDITGTHTVSVKITGKGV